MGSICRMPNWKNSARRHVMPHCLIFQIMLIGPTISGCGSGDYEFRKRPDSSEVAVLKDIQHIFPVFASEVAGVLEGIKVQSGPGEGSIGRAEIKNKIVQLYEQKDQLNAQLRDFVVARYQSYINAELDPNDVARERGRKSWDEVTKKVQMTALELRKVKGSIERAAREHAEAKERANAIKKQKADSSQTVSEAGKEIEFQVADLAQKHKEVKAAREAASQVHYANQQLDDAIKSEQVPKARAAAEKIEGNVSSLQAFPEWEVLNNKNTRLQTSVHNYEQAFKIWKAQLMTEAEAEEKLAETLDEAAKSVRTAGSRLTANE
jgi:hypothetical protein